MIEIVPETPELHAGPIEALFDRTFGPGHFAKTAERLREYNRSLPDISRVALDDGQVVGVARAWPLSVDKGGLALFVGPVAVDPDHRGDRLGLSVTRELLEAGRRAGWPGAILIGAPAYFSDAGFRLVPPGLLVMPGPQDEGRIMVCDLAGDANMYAGQVRAVPDAAPGGQRTPAQSRVNTPLDVPTQ